MGKALLGLQKILVYSRTEAKEIIDNYKKEFANIQKYMDETIQFCKTNGYVQTLMGRKRWLKDINSVNFTFVAMLNEMPSIRQYKELLLI